MARRCTICDHPERTAIDKALVAGMPFRKLAARFSVSSSAAFRHKREHLPKILAQGLRSSNGQPDPHAKEIVRYQQQMEAEETRHAIDAFQQLRAINSACLEVLTKARATEKHSTLLNAVDRITRQIDLQARLLGELQEGPVVNIAVMPEWLSLRQTIVDALRPFPEARVAVAEVLQNAVPGA